MRRKTKVRTDTQIQYYDFMNDVGANRLQAIGAICLAWNWLEGAVDEALGAGLGLHPDLFFPVNSRINGMDGKLGVIRACLTHYSTVEEVHVKTVQTSLGAIGNYKKLRDGVIHVRLLSSDAIIGETPQWKSVDEVLVSEEALFALYRRLEILAWEAMEITKHFYTRHLIMHTNEENVKRRAVEGFQRATARLQDLQKDREALPPLPEFPESPPKPPETEAAQEPRG